MNRNDFLEIVYNELRDDPTNDRANRIIDAFDSVDTVEVVKCKCPVCGGIETPLWQDIGIVLAMAQR